MPMETILPHVEIGLGDDDIIKVSVEDYELFDFVEDYIIEQCNLNYLYMIPSENRCGNVYTMFFDNEIGVSTLQDLLMKLDPQELKSIYLINN